MWYRVGDTVYFDNSEHEIIGIADNGVVTTRGTDGELQYDSSEMFDALTFTDDRSRQLRRSRLKPDTETPAAQKKVMRVPSANFHITNDHLKIRIIGGRI